MTILSVTLRGYSVIGALFAGVMLRMGETGGFVVGMMFSLAAFSADRST